LLSKSAETLCTSCHDLAAQAIAAAPVKHPPAAAGACLACHGAHVTANEHLLTQPPKETCRACHPEVLAETMQPGFSAHPPARDGECSACHVAHGSEHAGLVKQAIPALCVGCHDLQKPGFAEKHLGLATDTTNCSNCHAPHAAPGEGLFWPHRHTPFAEQKCEECHGAKK
jgi:predicted CXXCH cytochrome family protein